MFKLEKLLSRFIISFHILFFFQVLFFITLEKFFFYSSIENSLQNYKFYLISILSIFIIYIFLIKKFNSFQKFNELELQNLSTVCNIVIIIVLLSSVLYLICKILPIYNYLDFSDVYSKYSISCILISLRSAFLNVDNIVVDKNFQNFYNIFSPLSTLGINLLHILVFLLIFFYERFKKSNFLILFAIFFSLFVYFLATQSKNVILNVFIFSFSLTVCKFILHNKITINPLISISFFCFFIIFSNYFAKQNCYENIGEAVWEDYGNSYLIESEYGKVPPNGGEMFPLKRKSVPEIWHMRYSDLVMFQEFLYYMLTGKLQGEYIYENIKRDFVNHTVIQKTIHSFTRDFGINQKMPLFEKYKKSAGGVSFLHLVWFDYWYFGLLLFVLVFVLLVKVSLHKKFNFNEICQIFNIFLITVFFFIFLQMMNWYSIEIMNSRFIFLNFFIFLIIFFKKNIILKKTEI